MEEKTNMLKMWIKLLVMVILFSAFTLSYTGIDGAEIIISKQNFSYYAYADLAFTVLSCVTNFSVPLILMYFIYDKIENNGAGHFWKSYFIDLGKAVLFVASIFVSILICYLITCTEKINLGFADRSGLQFILPAGVAIPFAAVLMILYFNLYGTVARIISLVTKRSWIGVLLAIGISFLDTGLRFIFGGQRFIGILPSDNVVLFYLDDRFWGIDRPGYIYSLVYFVLLNIGFTAVHYFISKRLSIRRNTN